MYTCGARTHCGDMLVDSFFFFLKGSAEDPIRQDLRAVAEDVAASVLHSNIPSYPDLQTRDKAGEEDIEEGNFEANAQVILVCIMTFYCYNCRDATFTIFLFLPLPSLHK